MDCRRLQALHIPNSITELEWPAAGEWWNLVVRRSGMNPAIKLMDSSSDLLRWNASPGFEGGEYWVGYLQALKDTVSAFD